MSFGDWVMAIILFGSIPVGYWVSSMLDNDVH